MHYDIVCPGCLIRMGGCRCPGPFKSTVENDKPCPECEQKMIDALADALEAEGVDLDTIGEHYVQQGIIPYEEAKPEGTLTDKVLSQMEMDASWHGFTEMGAAKSIDNELASGRSLQSHVSKLVAEVRRLRALVPEDQRIVIAPSQPPFPEPERPMPRPPFQIPRLP